ncbi:domain-containing protein [Sphingobium amiense]|uniref:Domain-containing protein n=1 Tax=Sphingobium amiense TaxID=135719 RepID=A0A494W1E9_9SPHN|nr:DUF2147 domain-containing protein [Sphingobium amiense]BBD97146.1 domain-containing protein [Sphingobium amiense]
MTRVLIAIWAAWMLALPGMAQGEPSLAGEWINPRGSVIVATAPCQGGLCGWVRWANGEALADAQDAGVAHLVGTQLLQDYKADGRGRWSGRVYVPDIGRTFSSTIRSVDPTHVRISGCLVGSWICKSQIWSRPRVD